MKRILVITEGEMEITKEGTVWISSEGFGEPWNPAEFCGSDVDRVGWLINYVQLYQRITPGFQVITE